MKKIFCLTLVLILAFTAGAYAEKVGTFRKSSNVVDNFQEAIIAGIVAKDFVFDDTPVKAYDSVTLMQLALNNGEIDSFTTPDFVGEYFLRTNPDYNIRAFFLGRNPVALALGFLEEKKELRDKFNKVIEEMEAEGKIGLLARDFITGPKAQNPEAVEFAKFDGAETINIAVTGDMPPLDYVDAAGRPAGFNTAILSEIGKRLKMNINLVNVETGARAIALKSGRADVVFWLQVFTGYENFKDQPDIPEGVIVSTPYYGWNKVILIGKKK